VPSSTSSSEIRLWRKTWLVTLALSLAFLASWEAFWRLEGFTPKINNDENLWALVRGRVSGAGRDAVILIGSSQMQLAIAPDSFTEATGWERPFQLAIPMGPSVPVLRELSADPSVSGRIICEVYPTIFFDMTHQLDHVTARYFRRRADFTPADEIEAGLRTFTQRSLISSLPALFPNQLVRAYRAGHWPQPSHASFDAERFGRSDFRLMGDIAERRRSDRRQWKSWKGHPARPAEVAQVAERVDALVSSIRAKGGDVIFVRLPTSAFMRQWEHRVFPRSEFWDVFAEATDALTLHFEDHPALRRYRLPDGSHLDQRDAPAFSKALGEILVRELGRRAS